jgi:hypothetical protein
VIEEQWTIAGTEEDGARVLFRFRQQIPTGVQTSRYPHVLNIYWRFDGRDTEGMPPSSILDHMGELEQRLDPLEGEEFGYLVLCITGNNRKEWVWYVAEPAAFMKELNVAFAGAKQFPVEFEAALDPGWENFRDLIAAATSPS